MKFLKNPIIFTNSIKSFCFLGVCYFLLCQTTFSLESSPRDKTHRGVVDISQYQIYPENRIGNGIYLEKKLLDTHPERTITNIVDIKKTKSSVYLYRNKNGDSGLGIIKNKEDGEARFWKVDTDFYQYSNRYTGLQRVFRIFNNKIIPLLANVRTARGIASSPSHVVFYHIINSQEIPITNNIGQTIKQRLYTFRLHLVNKDIEKIESINNLIIKDTNYNLKLSWENSFSVSYKLNSGKKQIVNLREYVPDLF